MANLWTLIDREKIDARVQELGAQITEQYRDRDLVLLVILKGSFVFAADLARAIDLPLEVDFLGLRSYGDGTESSGVVQITSDVTKPIEGKDVIVVEDIVDTGLTMAYLFQNLETRRPRSVKLAALLHKPARTRVPVNFVRPRRLSSYRYGSESIHSGRSLISIHDGIVPSSLMSAMPFPPTESAPK